ncbi:MAG: hypothetical protein ACR2MG_00200 [Pyrinomonadaceae bacterium]
MANVSNVRLAMGRVSDRMEFAEVSFSINFSGQEVKENLVFGLYIPLFEIDDDLDIYHLEPNGAFSVGINWQPVDDRDDFVTWISAETIRPNGNSTIFLTRRKEFDVGNQESGNEEYKALVWVIPEIVEGKAWSNTLSINLG